MKRRSHWPTRWRSSGPDRLSTARSTTWAPAASGRVRVVEAAVLAAIGAYFSLGLVKLVGWL